jgi:hypothetical protein
MRYLLAVLFAVLSLKANAGLFGFGGMEWKEEVLLHDGSKIIVERSVKRGGRHELFKGLPISEQRLSWRMPGTNQAITWEDHFSKDVGSATLLPMLVDVHQGSAYVVADPMGCLAYNKWGRPNPPYVVFRHQGKEWQRIPLQELPLEIKTPNLIHSEPDVKAERNKINPISAEEIQKIVASNFRAEFRSIVREELPSAYISQMCEELIHYKGAWIMPNDPVARRMVDHQSK